MATRLNYDYKCWFGKEENRGYISLLEWGISNLTAGYNPHCDDFFDEEGLFNRVES